ncbi:hypothetical protein HN018_06710 [Lichenicola cladoniae]|uniref:Uncharacterized protein n=1 Tax=Lichenicola cladoniae TaxID=1484109 RepID=A0A6M8HN28_9PROT|nr:hypothetical protein [Lichenicola cladoniae]NPD67263.1 hypothetical protein [Acetobacteraceae bacterium]QKE89768.1 hypothetical protein HN018_06710 [Lichenicola cladoniae]
MAYASLIKWPVVRRLAAQMPTADVLGCVDRIGCLSARYAPTTRHHEHIADRLVSIEAAIAARHWIQVSAGLSALRADVEAFSYPAAAPERVAAAVAEAKLLLSAALALSDRCERSDGADTLRANPRFKLLQGGRS